MKGRVFIIILFINLIIGFFAFNIRPGKLNYDAAEAKVKFENPSNFPKPVYLNAKKNITSAGFRLGRILFYEQALSLDQSKTCGSCHQSNAGFANLNQALSRGVKGCTGTRNAPPLFNLAWHKEFMWDGRVNALETSSTNALTNPCEMANEFGNVITRLSGSDKYKELFKKAYGDPEINKPRVLNALGQFMAMLVSDNSRYDKYIRHEAGGVFNTTEKEGYVLFKEKCSSCHQEPLFTDLSYRSNGLDLYSRDRGRDSISHQKTDVGKFKVPSLRNIEVTAPYMHDGRFTSLKQVLDHYRHGVQLNANLDPKLKQGNQQGIKMTDQDQVRIIAFLKTLTDKEFLNDPRFQVP